MRRDDLPRLVQALREPMRTFVRESRARTALLVSGSGQVLAQHGFAGAYQVMNVASLAAAAHSASRALAEIVQSGGWQHLFHAGSEQHLFLAPLRTPVEELIVVAIFDDDTSLGIVQLFYERLEQQVAALPEFRSARPATTQANFERDLEAGLEFLSQEP